MTKGQKGKIAATEWSAIAARHRRGESLASIARAYGCTAPAISYIIRRSEREGSAAKPRRSGLEHQLRERVNSDVAVFLVAFGAACDELTSETRGKLLEATDRLLRAGARVRIELERSGSET